MYNLSDYISEDVKWLVRVAITRGNVQHAEEQEEKNALTAEAKGLVIGVLWGQSVAKHAGVRVTFYALIAVEQEDVQLAGDEVNTATNLQLLNAYS